MVLTDYTTYADIRAVLGVSDDDLDDATLALTLYSDYLQGELEDIALTLPSTYTTVKVLVSPDAAQVRFLAASRLFATYSVAKQLTAALPLFAAKQVTDGKAAVSRFDTSYRDVVKSVNEQYEKLRARLVAAVAALGTTTTDATARIFFSTVQPSVDVITNT